MEQIDNLRRHEYFIPPKYFVSGQFSHKFHRNYVSLIVVLLAAISIFAQVRFPEQYSMFLHTISHQGSKLFNPEGHQLWNLGIILIGFLMIPHFLKLFHVFKPISSLISAISSGFGVVSSISLSFVGFFPLEFHDPHYIFAGICFGGIFLTANMYLLLLVIRMIRTKQKTNSLKSIKSVKSTLVGLSYILFNTGFFVMAITYQLSGDIVAIWEWVYFISIILWLFASLMLRSILKNSKLN